MSAIYKIFKKSKARNIAGALKNKIIRENYDYSQNLEYTRLKPLLDAIPKKVVLDVGAHDGKSYSNSYPLLARGWHGYLVEPNPHNCNAIKSNCTGFSYTLIEAAVTPEKTDYIDLYFDSVTPQNYRASIKKPEQDDWSRENLSSTSIEVKAYTLDELTQAFDIPRDIGLLSIDIEGLDTKVIRTMSLLSPYVIIIEIDFTSYSEARDRSMYLLGLGYLNVFRLGCNEVYINTNYEFFGERIVKKFVENNF